MKAKCHSCWICWDMPEDSKDGDLVDCPKCHETVIVEEKEKLDECE